MDFLKTYLAALGGTATVLLLAGFFGKTLLEHWFKKDFAHFQASLDAIAEKDKARLEYLHPERAKAMIQIFGSCNELQEKLLGFIAYYEFKTEEEPKYTKDSLARLHAVRDKVTEIRTALVLQKLHFKQEVIAPLEKLLDHCETVTRVEVHEADFSYAVSAGRIAEKVKAIEEAFKQVLGSDSL